MKTEFIYLLLVIFILPFTTNGQFAVIKGTITNEKSGDTLENVNLLETLSGIGTISNSTGEFRLMLNPGDAELLITLDGYKNVTKQIKLVNDTTINIQLEPQMNLKIRQKAGVQPGLAHKTEKK
ncbi:MAG: carboxypeptidase-like regulatory domain-containing protein [Prolixibacteraceae bacterium]|nr:carboxypeptidase-like regulatory domain-containing protein [Prolixibacteraceae bacterium]